MPELIYNYHETNVSNNLGKKKYLMKRRTKYLEQAMNNSQACTSLMFCGSASGKLLPPHVIYEAKNIYKNWIEGVLEVTQSGWFDKETLRKVTRY